MRKNKDEGSIRLSEKHGVNPMLVRCFYCNKDTGEIALLGRLPNDAEAPRQGVINHEPCDECKDFMRQGIILISVREDSDRENPYRTGGWVVVKEEYIRRILDPAAAEPFCRRRVGFVPDEVWDALGLPRQ